MDRVEIIGTGSALPSLCVPNSEFEKIMDTSDEWIKQRTGISERRLAVDETAVSLACEAGKNALEMAKMDAKEIEFIVVATTSADNAFPHGILHGPKRIGHGQCSGYGSVRRLYRFYLCSQRSDGHDQIRPV